ncbi:NAD(P)H-hydrate dehydratase [Paracoccus sediminis]|uniref:Bifunctional NAD(P)H-hydrate repair enzyme n=1 Tax=Paracoccus sediminis TaxID=1214787 RepID=A0A238Y370_9RHOB|nr:NAD(P)H-hydrate dehydratase [Paracoccus sediminis]TBN47244.1 NAD(P)H-hydrate dehydratase [Paracoccus sediminis]SNR65726.1 yjeF C-terminal region, hydroxyethylthiazole kinase-related/yjeF N-terminal region [Paracoccus sediminis]
MFTGREVSTTAQMRALETKAIQDGRTSGLELMERAGAAVVAAILCKWPNYHRHSPGLPSRAIVLCGPGNNGGDGFVVARLLAGRGWKVQVDLLGDPDSLPPDARTNHDRWRAIGPVGRITPNGAECYQAEVLVDALFGIGLSRPLANSLWNVFDGIYDAVHSSSGGPRSPSVDHVVAIDVPSGLCADSGRLLAEDDLTVWGADLTVTFGSLKPGHLMADGPDLCRDVVVADIGLPGWPPGPRIHRLVRGKIIKPDGHKYDHGHALILAGPSGHGGAARLSARAALRMGAGLVTVCPPQAAMPDHIRPPDALMLRPVDTAEDLGKLLEDSRITALCLGPGCGVDRADLLLEALLDSGRAAVLDADALTALSRRPNPFAGLPKGCVLTPHMGEFARLFPDLAERLNALPTRGPAWSKLDAARAAAARSGVTILLKGPDSVIADPDERANIHSAFDIPWLATAGAGDVLAGMVTGLLARNFQPFDAAGMATLIHARAARLFGPGLIADDLPDMIPAVLRNLA